jgi:hypothetical protein
MRVDAGCYGYDFGYGTADGLHASRFLRIRSGRRLLRPRRVRRCALVDGRSVALWDYDC